MIPTYDRESRAKRYPLPPAGERDGGRGLVNRPYFTGKKKDGYGITIYEGGTLLHLEAPTFKSKIVYEEGRNRGSITDFSYKSHQNLKRTVFGIDIRLAGLPLFGHLTYPGEFTGDARRWKRDLDTWIKAIVRKWPEIWGPWKLEFQQRGAPHFHVLLWGGPEMETMEVYDVQKRRMIRIARPDSMKNREIYDWFSNTWYRIVGSGDEKHLRSGTTIQPIQSVNGVLHYTAKYLAKMEDGKFTPPEFVGRFWGKIQKKKWRVSKTRYELPAKVAYRISRVLRKLHERAAKRVAAVARGKGQERPAWTKKRRKNSKIPQGMHWYMDSVTSMQLLAWAAREE